ncbi:MAG: hypothetical protein Q9169_001372 [Polycauliona sp. 2 TL-2023]
MTISIGEEINAATRSHHTTLNQLIIQFLPFSLPPHTSDVYLYALGISHFLPIYSAFESSLRTYNGSKTTPSRTRNTLQALHLPRLERAEALRKDLHTLLPPRPHDAKNIHRPRLEAFERHIQLSLALKPHLLVSYTWIFYMALFSGGRYIRSKLRAGFTPRSTSRSQRHLDEQAGLGFWNFPGDADGEDLRIDFKARIATFSKDLTEEERAEIIAEGVHIMTSLTGVVEEVAVTVPNRAAALAEDADIRSPWVLLLRNLLPLGLMDLFSAATGNATSSAQRHDGVTPRSMQVVAK